MPTREPRRRSSIGDTRPSSSASLTNDKGIVKHLKSEFGEDTPLAEITAGRISEYKARRLAAVRRVGKGETTTERRLTAAAVNRPLALLRHVLRLAPEEWEELPGVPTIRLEREPQGRIRWLEPDEEIRLLDACRQSRTKHLTNVVKVALESGLRRRELVNLTWGQVDLSRGVLRLEKTKSGRRREVPMRQRVYDVLAARAGDRKGPVWPAGDVRSSFESAVAAARLDRPFYVPRVPPPLRELVCHARGSLAALQQLLGHATLTMTMRYAHLSQGHRRDEIARTERPAAPMLGSKETARSPCESLSSGVAVS